MVQQHGHGIGHAGWTLLAAWVTLLFRLEHKGWTKKVSEARAAEHLEA